MTRASDTTDLAGSPDLDLILRPASDGSIAAIPGERAPVYRIEVPAGLRDAVRRRIVAQQLAGLLHLRPETVETRVGPTDATGTASVLVLDREEAAALRARAASAGPGPSAVFPDYLLLPTQPDSWTIRIAKSRLVVRFGPDDGFAAPLAFGLPQLAAALARRGKPRAILLDGQIPQVVQEWLDHLDGVVIGPFATTEQTIPDPAFDLLRDDLADRARLAVSLRRWVLPAGLAAAGCAGLALALWFEVRQLQADRIATQDAARSVAREVFLGDAPILSLRQQVAREITTRQSAEVPARPLDTLRTALIRLQDAPIELVGIDHSGAAEIALDLRSPDFGSLEAVVASLSSRDTGARILRSSSDGADGVSALVAIGPGAAR